MVTPPEIEHVANIGHIFGLANKPIGKNNYIFVVSHTARYDYAYLKVRGGFTSNSTGVRYKDNEYVMNGICSIFLFTEPLAGWREAVAKQQRTRTDWAEPSARLSMERTAAGSLSTTNTSSVEPIINYISMACRLDMMISSAT